jgi:chemotaxis protein methyltransferase CheR
MTTASNSEIRQSIRHVGSISGAVAQLRDCVHEQTGLYFDDSKGDVFLDKLSPLIAEQSTPSLMDYYYFLKYDSAAAFEWKRVFDALTVQESFFWREMDQIRVLVDEIIPQYFKNHPNRTLHIWSAACAAGEEPITLGIALQEAGWFDREDIRIHASDASPRAIDAAKKGVYRERSFRNLPSQLRQKYFSSPEDGVSRVSGELQSRIEWKLTNLMSAEDRELAPMTSTVVFCRNVFIYFSDNATRTAVCAFAERMPRPAYFFVGIAESLMKITCAFELREIGDAFVYVKS